MPDGATTGRSCRKAVSLHGWDEDAGPLQALGLVDGHDVDRIGLVDR